MRLLSIQFLYCSLSLPHSITLSHRHTQSHKYTHKDRTLAILLVFLNHVIAETVENGLVEPPRKEKCVEAGG